MESPAKAADTVISALKDRKIPIKRDEIESAFSDETNNTENAKWVIDHLGNDTLLSQEELTLYSKLESSGALQSILHDPDINATRPFVDDDLRHAIESLNASTAAIKKQTEILTSQCESLNKQFRLEGDRRIRQNRDIERLRQKHESGTQNMRAASSDLAHELELSLKGESEKATTEGKRILSSLTARFKEDDRILAELERLASGIKYTNDDTIMLKRTSELGAMLAEYVAEEIQYRLDRLYLESITAGLEGTTNKSTEIETEALVALEEELESLYSEIDILAKMSTKQQFSEPILRELQNYHGQLRLASHRKLEYILDMVTEMTSSTENLTKSLRDRESFCGALEALTASYRSEIGDQYSDQAASRRETLNLRRRSMQPTPVFNPPEKRIGSPESQALAGLLRRMGLSFDSVFQSEEEDGGAIALLDKKQHMIECLRNLGLGADSPLVAALVPSDQAFQLLASSLNANSHFQTSLSNVDHEKRLAELESQLGYVQKGIERLNLDVLYQRDKSQEKFLDKWT